MPSSFGLFILKCLPNFGYKQVISRPQVDQLNRPILRVTEKHVFWLQISMDYADFMQFFNLKTNLVKNVADEPIIQHTKAPAMLPHLIFASEHFI